MTPKTMNRSGNSCYNFTSASNYPAIALLSRRTSLPPPPPSHTPSSSHTPPPPSLLRQTFSPATFSSSSLRPPTRSIRSPQLLRQILQLLHRVNLNNPPHLRRIPHQLLRARIQHAQLCITRNREIVKENVRDREAARGLVVSARDCEQKKEGGTHQCERVGEQHEARRVVGQVFGDVLEVFVDCLILVLFDLECCFVDQVCGWRG